MALNHDAVPKLAARSTRIDTAFTVRALPLPTAQGGVGPTLMSYRGTTFLALSLASLRGFLTLTFHIASCRKSCGFSLGNTEAGPDSYSGTIISCRTSCQWKGPHTTRPCKLGRKRRPEKGVRSLGFSVRTIQLLTPEPSFHPQRKQCSPGWLPTRDALPSLQHILWSCTTTLILFQKHCLWDAQQ